MRTRIHVLNNDISSFHDISCFITIIDSVIHQYICHEDMPSFGEGGCDRLKALKGALFRSTLLTRPQTRVCGFSSPKRCKLELVHSLRQNHLLWREPAPAGGRWSLILCLILMTSSS